MNYILNQIDRKINFLKSAGKETLLRTHYQSKFEFILNLILGYLWNKNWESLLPDDKEYVINCILKPSIGSVISISRKLDVEAEFFGNKKFKRFYQSVDEYSNLRNEKIGHGFSFEDDTSDFLKKFDLLFEKINDSDISLFNSEWDLVFVEGKKDFVYYGTNFKPDGATYVAWSCPEQVTCLKEKSLYLFNGNIYYRISPFILQEEDAEMFIFCSIEEKLTGRVKYNRLIKTGVKYIDTPEFSSINITNEGHKRKTSNGTIINNYQNNYRKYIDVGIAKKIISFLTSNKSSVFATIWGHGGVGKTASIQYVCEYLCNKENKEFDYIIFLSAKDRFYNYYQGKIQRLDESISSLNQIISYVNNIIINYSTFDLQNIIEFGGKLLLIIDDFETFSKEEKNNIIEFIRKLNINHHKIILTTRAATLVTGEEIQTTELNEDETINFLEAAIQNEIPTFNIELIRKDLKQPDYRRRIFEITSGRPLFILQFTILLGQKASLQEAVLSNIKSTEEAKNFLYDRIYDYLSLDAKNMFLAISLLVIEDDLSGLIDNLRFLLNKEDKEDQFQSALNELVKLKILIIEDKEFFKVYSIEIYKYMKFYYQSKGEEYDGSITSRFNLISANKELSTELALLETADASRMLSGESEVENKYRYILNRDKAPLKVKIKAILNLSKYLFTHKGREDKTLKLFSDYYHLFNRMPDFIKAYTSYCWAEGSFEAKNKAIDILKDYFSTKPKIETEIFLDLLGTLMMYMSIQIINEREELKELFRFGDIKKNDYDLEYKNQKDKFNNIYHYPGLRLYNQVKTDDLMLLSPNCRNSVLNGLMHFVEISIRTNRREIGKEVCNKIISELPQNFQSPFLYRLKKIDSIEHPEIKINPFQSNTETDIAIKLKEALKK